MRATMMEKHYRKVWIDVGSHLGEKTLAAAKADPALLVYAFEPNTSVALRSAAQAPNFIVLPVAVGENDGPADFYVNDLDAASSLLPFNSRGLDSWTGKDQLRVARKICVPCMRLDSFMEVAGISTVEYLKIDAQGADLAVVRSAGARLRDIQRVSLEVQVTSNPLYVGSADRETVLDFMVAAGFDLESVEPQSFGQEENLTFVNRAFNGLSTAGKRSACEDSGSGLRGPVHQVSLEDVSSAYQEATIESHHPLRVATAPEQWSYAAAIPLAIDSTGEQHLVVQIQARVLEGEIGFGVLAHDERSFLVEKFSKPSAEAATITLPLPPSVDVGRLIIRNGALDGTVSKVIVEEVGIWEAEAPASTTETQPPSAELGQAAWDPSNEELLEKAKSLCCVRPLFPYPNWRFDADWNNPDAVFRARRRIWAHCRERQRHLPLEMNWHEGLRLCVHLGNDLSRQIFVAGCIDPNELFFLSQILERGMTFVDAGANEGIYTLFASRRVGVEGRVWAFEPSRRELSRLRYNLELNQLSNVQLFPCALAETRASASLSVADLEHAGQNTLGVVAREGITVLHQQQVELRTLDDLVLEHGPVKVDVLKADVEGAELRLFQGAGRVLREHRPWLVFEVSDLSLKHQGGSAEALFAHLRALDYALYRFSPTTGLPVRLDGDVPSDNMVGVPSEKALPEGIASTVALL